MSRPPSSQQMNSQKQQARMPSQSERSTGSSKSPYLNPNFLPSPHLQQQSKQGSPMGSAQNSREMRQQNEFNQLMHHMDMMPQNPQQQQQPAKKPSLLSGYHNPSFSPNDRNDLMAMNQLARFYVPPQPLFMGGNPRRSPNNPSDESKSNPNQSQQQQGLPPTLNRPNSNQFTPPAHPPSMHSPSQIHQQMLQSGFSPAAIAAAQAALNSTNPTNFSQLIQQQLHLQHLQHLQSQFQPQQQHPDNNNTNKKQEANPQQAAPNLSPRTQTQQQQAPLGGLPASVPTPPSASTSINTSSCYVPEVEAISPTPEDQKENSSLQAIKDKIIQEICKVEKDIASTQYQFDMLEKKQKEIKELHARPLVDENGDKCIKLTTTLAEKIYQENRKKADESHKVLKPNSALTNGNTPVKEASFDEDIPIYHEFSDTKISQDIRKDFETVMKQRLVKFFKRQHQQKKQREKFMIEEYDSLHAEWQKKVDKIENNFRKKQKDAKCREFYEKVFPELRKSREERERAIQKVKTAIADKLAKEKAAQEAAANPEAAQKAADLAAAAAKEAESNGEIVAEPEQPIPPDPVEEERKRMYQLAVVTPLCMDERQKRFSFLDNNGFVKDPVALFKAAKNQTFWNEKEKEIFLDKLLLFGKNFEIIARFLDKKQTQDCIEYYYLTKKKINYKMLIRKQARKRKNQKQNVAALLASNGGATTPNSTTFPATNNATTGGSTPSYNSQTQLVNSNTTNETSTEYFDGLQQQQNTNVINKRALISVTESSATDNNHSYSDSNRSMVSNRNKNSRQQQQSTRNSNEAEPLCFVCKKLNRFKGKSRPRSRSFPRGLGNLANRSLNSIKRELNLPVDSNLRNTDARYPFCKWCFKRTLSLTATESVRVIKVSE